MENMFGMVRGKYFGEPPLYVDKTLPAGMTDLPKPTVISWLRNSPFVLVTTPNFVWAAISLALYMLAPYNLGPNSTASIAPISSAFFIERFPVWFSITFGYFSFWHATLYGFNMANRPFIANRVYNLDKVLHNVFWTTSGIAIWTVFENVFAYLWATGRLPYISDTISVSTPWGLAAFVAAFMGIPVWRSVHFYFAHRFLHYTPLYKQVHSLHHRNTDIEPFSGLCMHPVEHLYYFACIVPSLVFYCSPFALVWNGIHLLLSPAASHSGYEDHFQSDMFHYLHHRYFECNYAGTDAAFMDLAFGTFKASFKDHPVDKNGPKPRDDAKSTLRILPTQEFVTYLAGSALCVLPWIYTAQKPESITPNHALVVSSAVGFGPVLLASIVSHFYSAGTYAHPVKMSLVANLLHLVLGTLFCSVPITYGCWLTLIPKN
uniref:Fatty acid hydroxylase domain-containing protein n=1 Tax=viral metagenome TaxID=1070528 RepID=A0A6C0KW33_9ZZZZ